MLHRVYLFFFFLRVMGLKCCLFTMWERCQRPFRLLCCLCEAFAPPCRFVGAMCSDLCAQLCSEGVLSESHAMIALAAERFQCSMFKSSSPPSDRGLFRAFGIANYSNQRREGNRLWKTRDCCNYPLLPAAKAHQCVMLPVLLKFGAHPVRAAGNPGGNPARTVS